MGLHPNERVLLVASFDGVLADYEHDPNYAHLTPARVAQLRRLLAGSGTVVVRGVDAR